MKAGYLPVLLLWSAVALAGSGLILAIWQSVWIWSDVLNGKTYSVQGPSSAVTWFVISALLLVPLALTILSIKIGRVERRRLLWSASILSILWTIYPSVCVAALYSRQNHGSDDTDTKALAAYQKIKPGTFVIVVLKVDTTFNGVDVDSTGNRLEQEGTIASITDDTLTLFVDRNGHTTSLSYAGRMIREIHVKNQPNHTADPGSSIRVGAP